MAFHATTAKNHMCYYFIFRVTTKDVEITPPGFDNTVLLDYSFIWHKRDRLPPDSTTRVRGATSDARNTFSCQAGVIWGSQSIQNGGGIQL